MSSIKKSKESGHDFNNFCFNGRIMVRVKIAELCDKTDQWSTCFETGRGMYALTI